MVKLGHPAQALYNRMHVFKIYDAVVNRGERPCRDAFVDVVNAAKTSEAEREAVQLYMGLMERCWATEPVQRPSPGRVCSFTSLPATTGTAALPRGLLRSPPC
jgi:hypothetical protein